MLNANRDHVTDAYRISSKVNREFSPSLLYEIKVGPAEESVSESGVIRGYQVCQETSRSMLGGIRY